MKYEPKDVPKFKEEVCKMTCVLDGKCVNEGKDDHWFLMCPHYHSWKLECKSFVWDEIAWQEKHPEEVEKKHKQDLELAKKLKEEKKKVKKNEK